MMKTHRNRVARRRPGPDWTVRQVTPRADWSDEVEPCAFCGERLSLQGAHVGADLVHDRPASEGKLTFERERFVFCDRTCVGAWRAAEY